MQTPTSTVAAFIHQMNHMEIDTALALLADDVVYHNIPMRPVVGREAVRAFLARIPCEAMDWIVHVSAEHDTAVLNERTDRFRLTDGRWLEIRVVGVFEVLDGRITAWRDYFDMAEFQREFAPA